MSTRREFLVSVFGWLPGFRRRRRVTWAGIEFRVLRRGRSTRRYLLIHGNESTARQVLTEHFRSARGVAHLVTHLERNVRGPRGARDVVFDPNRIFSREGAARNLRRLNPQATQQQLALVERMLDRGRGKLLEALLPRPGGLLVALHNNTPGYSVHDEVPISDRTSLPDPDNPSEFFLVTQVSDFEILARSPFNVVLQNQAPPDDDGSLSRLAARRQVRYVNIECGLGRTDRQRQMLDWLEQHLP